jgi:hypothetical protein
LGFPEREAEKSFILGVESRDRVGKGDVEELESKGVGGVVVR